MSFSGMKVVSWGRGSSSRFPHTFTSSQGHVESNIPFRMWICSPIITKDKREVVPLFSWQKNDSRTSISTDHNPILNDPAPSPSRLMSPLFHYRFVRVKSQCLRGSSGHPQYTAVGITTGMWECNICTDFLMHNVLSHLLLLRLYGRYISSNDLKKIILTKFIIWHEHEQPNAAFKSHNG